MYICLCKEITDHQIKDAVEEGVSSFEDLQQQLGVATQCGECKCHARKCMRECNKQCSKSYLPNQTDTTIPLTDLR